MKLNRPMKNPSIAQSCFVWALVVYWICPLYSENQPAAAYEVLEIDYLTLLEERPSLNPSAILASLSSNVVIGKPRAQCH